jgi:hypothetical protein
MKKALGAVALLMASTVVGVPAAHAGGACVSKGEYSAVERGMTKRRVHRIFDTSGRRYSFVQAAGVRLEGRSYRPCRDHSAVSVIYGNGRVKSKLGIWG